MTFLLNNFNSSKVQLEHLLTFIAIVIEYHFNSSKVQLELEDKEKQ